MRKWADWLLEQPIVYRTWQAPFADAKFRPVDQHMGRGPAGRVLDVGCGPGTNAGRFRDSDYTGLDINEEYLARARARYQGRFVQADLMTADLSSLGRFDLILINSFLHHLPDVSVEKVLSQLTGLLHPDGRIHILELVLPERPSMARLMARLDRGLYPRSVAEWQARFERHFDRVVIEPYLLGWKLWSMVYFQGKGRTCGSR